MATSAGIIDIYKVSLGDSLVFSKISIGNDVVYTAGNTVTYHVDTGVTYTEEVDADETVLSPKSFIPTKNGWEFVGWRQDTTANNNVLAYLNMGDDPITLYAVFRQVVAVYYYNGNTTRQTATGYKYYNNGNSANPIFTISQATLSGWTPIGWSTSTTGNGGISYNTIINTEFTADTTLYGMYQQTITLSYNGNGNTSGATGAQTGNRYWNSGTGNILNPSFTLAANGFAKIGYTFISWRLNSVSGMAYKAGNTISLAVNTTMYAEWSYVGAPFYIVQSYTCKQTLSWTYVSGTNATNFVAEKFTAGSGVYTQLVAQFVDQTKNGSFTARSASINTLGNKTLQVKVQVDDAGGTITVNGITKEVPAGTAAVVTLTFDISSTSNFTITAKANAYSYHSGGIAMMIQEIYLY